MLLQARVFGVPEAAVGQLLDELAPDRADVLPWQRVTVYRPPPKSTMRMPPAFQLDVRPDDHPEFV